MNVADLGTKYVDKNTLERLVKLLGALWLQAGIKVAEAMVMANNNNNNNDYNANGVMVYAKEKMEDFTMTADLKDCFTLIAVVSLLVHLSLTITNKIVVGFLLKAMRAILKKCKKRNNDDEIEIQAITSMSGGEI